MIRNKPKPKPPSVVVLEWNDRIYRVPIDGFFDVKVSLDGSWNGQITTSIRIVGVE
jgi:hypothetical protein